MESNVRHFNPYPGVLISDNDYKTQQGNLNVWEYKARIILKCGGRKQNEWMHTKKRVVVQKAI